MKAQLRSSPTFAHTPRFASKASLPGWQPRGNSVKMIAQLRDKLTARRTVYSTFPEEKEVN